jgi:general secretion pathway protein G
MALLAPRLFGQLTRAKGDIARMQVTQLSQSLELYKLDNGTYPTTEQGLGALVHPPTLEPLPNYPKGGYLNPLSLIDPWGHPYRYQTTGSGMTQRYVLSSYGADGRPGGTGDDQDIVEPEP